MLATTSNRGRSGSRRTRRTSTIARLQSNRARRRATAGGSERPAPDSVDLAHVEKDVVGRAQLGQGRVGGRELEGDLPPCQGQPSRVGHPLRDLVSADPLDAVHTPGNDGGAHSPSPNPLTGR